MKRGIFWFRNDLRLRDNPALVEALNQCEEVLPVYVLDSRLLEKDKWGFKRLGPYRLKFLLESLEDLAEHLKEKSSRLLCVVGIPEQALPKLAAQYKCDSIFATKAYAHEEIKIEKRITEKVALHLYHSTALIHPEDVPFSIEKTPDVFTAFRKKIEKYSQVREPVEVPDQIPTISFEAQPLPSAEDLKIAIPKVDKRVVMEFKGGAMAGFERLDHYYWNSNAVATYKETRNGLIGADYSTKFSVWLANGSLSPRSIYYELENYEDELTKNQSTYWVKFELFWRDYFKFVCMKYGRKIFFPGGIQDKKVNWRDNPRVFYKWATGNTGDPFVDANMRELLLTGFMSNRGRQNVASYLVHKLGIDWRKGAAWFESLLIDYDVASNYGNWMYAAGVGNDPRDRIFNTKGQAERYDKDGAYRRLWLKDDIEEIEDFGKEYFDL